MIKWFRHMADWIQRYRFSNVIEATLPCLGSPAARRTMEQEIKELRSWRGDSGQL